MLSLLKRASITLVTSVALISTTIGLESANAADRAADRVVSSSSDRATAADCAQAKQKVKKAKKKLKKEKKQLKKAKRTNKSAKVIKAERKDVKQAKKKLKKKKAAKKRICTAADVQTQKDSQITQITNILNSSVLTALPAEVRDPLTAVLNDILAQLEGVSAGGDLGQLQDALATLQSLDPTGLAAALEGLSGALPAGDLAAVLDLLTGLGLDGAPELPAGDLASLTSAFEALLGGLDGFDPSDPTSVLAGVVELLTGLVDQLVGSADGFDTFLGLLSGLNGGALPTDPAQFLDIVTALLSGGVDGGLPFALPGDTGGLTDVALLFDALGGLMGNDFEQPNPLDLLGELGVSEVLLLLLAPILELLGLI